MTSNLPRRFRSRGMRAARFVAQRWLLKPLVWSLVRVRVEGRGRLDAVGPRFVAVAHHSSHLDAPLIFGALPWRVVRDLAAGAAADYFFDVRWRTGLTALFFNAFPVDRGGEVRRPGLARRLLEADGPVLLFPEGGRARNGEGLRRFKNGAAALAIATDTPVLPIGLVDVQKAMPRDRNWPVRGRPPVTVRFGDPLRHEAGETTEEFTRRIQTRVAELSGVRIGAGTKGTDQ